MADKILRGNFPGTLIFHVGDGDSKITITVTQTEDGALIEATDKNGATTAMIYNGKDGYTPQKGIDYVDGKDGDDGFSPTVSVSAISGGHRISVTDKNGTKTVDVMNGDDYTLTPADKNEIAELAAGMVDVPDYEDIDLSDYAKKNELPTKVSQLANDKGYLTEHQDISGKLDASALPEAVNDALAQAKASGEFDGTSVTIHSVSESQVDGEYNTIYFSDGTELSVKNGSKGSNGTPVTVKSVSESTEDGGSNVVTFSDGKTLTVKNGSKGGSPVKGVDYWIPADQEAIVQQVITALGTPVFGRVDADNNIILTGELADGTYTIKYEDAEGEQTVIGTLNHSYVPEPTYTNILPLAINSDKTPYNGGQGWKTGYRLNSSGAEVEMADMEVTGFIPVKAGDTVYLKNVGWGTDASYTGQTYIWVYDASFNGLRYAILGDLSAMSDYVLGSDNTVVEFKVTTNFLKKLSGDISQTAYMRINCLVITADSIITVNQPIV